METWLIVLLSILGVLILMALAYFISRKTKHHSKKKGGRAVGAMAGAGTGF